MRAKVDQCIIWLRIVLVPGGDGRRPLLSMRGGLSLYHPSIPPCIVNTSVWAPTATNTGWKRDAGGCQ